MKIDHGTVFGVPRERAGCASCISHVYTYEPWFLFAGKRFSLRWFPYLFGHFARFFFSGLLSVPRFSACPLIDLSLDRSIQSDSTISLFLTLFFLSLALSDFSIDYSAQVFLFARFYLFICSFSRADALYGITGDLREIQRFSRLSFSLFCWFFFWWIFFLSWCSRTHHNGRISSNSGFSGCFVRFVYSSFNDFLFFLRARPPLQLRSLRIRGALPARIFLCLV